MNCSSGSAVQPELTGAEAGRIAPAPTSASATSAFIRVRSAHIGSGSSRSYRLAQDRAGFGGEVRAVVARFEELDGHRTGNRALEGGVHRHDHAARGELLVDRDAL